MNKPYMRPARPPLGAGEWWICRRLIEYISPTHTMRPFLVKGEGCSPLVAYGAYLMDLGQLDRAIKMMGMGCAQAARALRYEIDAKVAKEIGTRVAQEVPDQWTPLLNRVKLF